MSKQTVSFYTQGCRLNQSETASIEHTFVANGYSVVPFNTPSNLVVVNTCTVTENGDRDTRQLVNRIHRNSPSSKIALIGCQSQILKDQLLTLPNVQWVIGNAEKTNLVSIIKDHQDQPVVIAPKLTRDTFKIPFSGIDKKHTRANIKIQDGCDFYCSFCVIPFARGPARSRDFDDIIRECVDLVAAGHKEIVITGINLGTYSNDNKTLIDVIEAMEKIDGLHRIRISSIEPTTIPKELIYKMNGDSKLCRYLHIPLQAGSNTILNEMSRKYTVEEFTEFIQFVHKTNPEICIGTDVIVGFPGETDALFEETYTLLKSLPIAYFHVFSYSERPHARSKKIQIKIPKTIIDQRSHTLRELSKQKKSQFDQTFTGTPQEILVEQKKRGKWTGLTDNYIRLETESDKNLKNTFLKVPAKSTQADAKHKS